jgi:exodeoxyribonuclease VII large subunit
MEPKGRGALQFAFEQLKEKLSQEGLFDPLHKKPLPHLPRKIGIVTSPTGAAIRDILQIIDRRFANVAILLYPVRVQGPGAAQEIAQAVTELSRWPQIDVLIVGRGGGSLEDLWAFNEEVVARAIFHSPIPIISAVGHEIDFTIADFVADLRAPTPSAAAELVVRNKVELVQSLVECEFRLTHAGRTFAQTKRERLASLLHRLSDPRKKVFDQRMRLDDFSFRLRNTFSHLLSQKAGLLKLKLEALFLLHPRRKMTEFSQGLSQLLRRLILAQRSGLTLLRQKTRGCGEKLHTLSPLAILERGYSIVRILPSREIVRQTSQIRVEDRVQVRVHQGEFVAKVEGVQEKQEDEPPSLTLGSGGV